MFQQLMHSWAFRPILLMIVCLLSVAAQANNNTSGLYTISTHRVQNSKSVYNGASTAGVYSFGNTVTMEGMLTPYVSESFSRSNYSSKITAVGAENPYTEDVAASTIRRVAPGGGIGDPGAIKPNPIGDIPWMLMGVMVLLFVWRSSKMKRL